jgi:mannose-6-phosphate isomerase-like protein (cupin superfamily)
MPSLPMLLQRPKFEDTRGYVYEAWRQSSGLEVRQITIVGCAPGRWKGLHFHPAKASTWTCVSGRCLARVGERLVPLRAGDGVLVYIPPNVSHDLMGLGRRGGVIVELDSHEFVEGDKIRL